jgi:actin-related protein
MCVTFVCVCVLVYVYICVCVMSRDPLQKVKVIAAVNPERRFAPWTGGSILGSLGNFTELWITKVCGGVERGGCDVM